MVRRLHQQDQINDLRATPHMLASTSSYGTCQPTYIRFTPLSHISPSCFIRVLSYQLKYNSQHAQEDQIIREQAERDFEIARIHAGRELEMMIAKLDRSNEIVAKDLSKYEEVEARLSHDEKVELIEELLMYQRNLAQIKKEDLDGLWSLVKETCRTTEVSDEKEKELWVEPKRLYKPNSRDPL
nr:hypothetical protein [Tanacetum cinerariifolium]